MSLNTTKRDDTHLMFTSSSFSPPPPLSLLLLLLLLNPVNSSDQRYFTMAYGRSDSLGGGNFIVGYLSSSVDSNNRISFNLILKQSSESFWIASECTSLLSLSPSSLSSSFALLAFLSVLWSDSSTCPFHFINPSHSISPLSSLHAVSTFCCSAKPVRQLPPLYVW